MSGSVSFNEVLSYPTREPDAVVAYGADPNQFGELWLPATSTERLLVLVHGGCWLNAFDVRHSRAMSNALAERGFAVWSIEYRRLGDEGGGYPGTFDDIKRAATSVDQLAGHGVWPTRVVLAGHSAGGHLALWLASANREIVHGVVGLAAIADLEQYSQGTSDCERATLQLLGGNAQEQPLRYQQVSPARLRAHPNTHLVHGTNDSIVPLAQADSVSGATVHSLQAGHFDLIHPETAAFETVVHTIQQAFE